MTSSSLQSSVPSTILLLNVCLLVGVSVCKYVCMCVCVCIGLEVNTTNEQLSREQHSKAVGDCFSLSSSVCITFSSMNMYYFGNWKFFKKVF